MEGNKKSFVLKIMLSLLFAAAIIGVFTYLNIEGDIKHNALYFSCVVGCAVLALLFIKFSVKGGIIPLALLAIVTANYFLVFDPTIKDANIIGLGILCVAQFLFFVYTMLLTKGVGIKVLNIAFRVGLCLIAYFVIKEYHTLLTWDWMFVMFLLNAFVTLLSLLFKLKSQWLLFFGLLLLFVSNVYIGLVSGWAIRFNVSLKFLEFLVKHDFSLYASIPGLLLVSLASVWMVNKKQH